MSASHHDATEYLVKKILALKFPIISVDKVVSVAPSLAEALKFQFSQHQETHPVELSINATALGKGFGGLVSKYEQEKEQSSPPLFVFPLGFLTILIRELLITARPLINNGAHIQIICGTLLPKLCITS